MMRHAKRLHGHAALLIAITVQGCISVKPEGDYQRSGELLRSATGAQSVFQPHDEGDAEDDVNLALRDGLTIEEAVRICLMHNPTLQASFFRVGMSRADVVQSGLFSNPSLALSVAFPEGGGRSNIQATLAQNIVDLWQIPIRKRIAQARLEQSILSLSQEAARLFADTKISYFAAVGAMGNLGIANANLDVARDLLQSTIARQKAGAVAELDVNLAQGAVFNNELEVQTARLDLGTAKRRLAVLLGLMLQSDSLELTDALPAAPSITLAEQDVVTIASASRLDLMAAREVVNAARQRVREEYAKVFPDIAVGTYLERNERRALPGRDIGADTARASIAAGSLTAPDVQSRGQRNQERRQEIDTIFGPALTMTLPIFDQNQAQIAKAKYAFEAAQRERDALERSIIQQARQTLDQAMTASRVSRFYEMKILPQARKNLDLANGAYRVGKTSIITVLDAQKSLLSTRRLAVSAQQAAASGWAELERVVGRPIADLVTQVRPAADPGEPQGTAPASQPAASENER